MVGLISGLTVMQTNAFAIGGMSSPTGMTSADAELAKRKNNCDSSGGTWVSLPGKEADAECFCNMPGGGKLSADGTCKVAGYTAGASADSAKKGCEQGSVKGYWSDVSGCECPDKYVFNSASKTCQQATAAQLATKDAAKKDDPWNQPSTPPTKGSPTAPTSTANSSSPSSPPASSGGSPNGKVGSSDYMAQQEQDCKSQGKTYKPGLGCLSEADVKKSDSCKSGEIYTAGYGCIAKGDQVAGGSSPGPGGTDSTSGAAPATAGGPNPKYEGDKDKDKSGAKPGDQKVAANEAAPGKTCEGEAGPGKYVMKGAALVCEPHNAGKGKKWVDHGESVCENKLSDDGNTVLGQECHRQSKWVAESANQGAMASYENLPQCEPKENAKGLELVKKRVNKNTIETHSELERKATTMRVTEKLKNFQKTDGSMGVSKDAQPENVTIHVWASFETGCKLEYTDIANKGTASSARPCGNGVMVLMAQRYKSECGKGQGDCSRNGFAKWVSPGGGGADDKLKLEDEHDCEATMSAIQAWSATGEALNMGMMATTQVMGTLAVSKTQQQYMQSGQNGGAAVQRDALNNGADLMEKTAYIQGGGATGHAMIFTALQVLENKADNRAMAIQNAAGTKMQGLKTNDGLFDRDDVSAAGLAAAAASKRGSLEDADEANMRGNMMIQQDVARHKQNAMMAKTLKIKSLMHTVMLTAQAAASAAAASNMRKQAAMFTDPTVEAAKVESTIVAGTPQGPVGPAEGPPGVMSPIVNGGTGEAMANAGEEVLEEKNIGGDMMPPAAFGGGGGPGGLKDAPSSGGEGGMLKPSESGGGGSGSGLSGGGGAGAGGGAAESGEKGAEALSTGGATGFGSAGGGAATAGGFASAGGAGAAKKNDTGNMDMNSILAQFLPKKDEAQGDKGPDILSYTKEEAARRGLASAADDGSILGPNGDPLFVRATRVVQNKYKAGQLKY